MESVFSDLGVQGSCPKLKSLPSPHPRNWVVSELKFVSFVEH